MCKVLREVDEDGTYYLVCQRPVQYPLSIYPRQLLERHFRFCVCVPGKRNIKFALRGFHFTDFSFSGGYVYC